MIKNYFKIAFRNLKNNKGYSIINITGLAVGITCCIIIILFVKNELSYDKFNKNADQVYRVVLKGLINNHELSMATSPGPMGAAVKNDLPEVVNYTRIRKFGSPVLRYKNKAFSEEKFFCVDSTFFDVFTVEFLEGNKKTALSKPNSVVITEAMAKKYFADEEPLGKILNADRKRDWEITGVVKSFPPNSHFHFDFLGSISSYDQSREKFWLSNNFYTYLLLRKRTDLNHFFDKFQNDVAKYIGPELQSVAGISFEKFKSRGDSYGYSLQSLTLIHLNSHLDYEIEANSKVSYVYIFLVIAFSILLIACINFINLSTARSEKRAKEVEVRKTLGSNKSQLISQFITEAVLMSLLAAFISIILTEIFLPIFNGMSGMELSLGLFDNINNLILFLFLIIIIGLAAGGYPAFYLSSFQPIKVLKNKSIGNKNYTIRNGLVVFQFSVSIILFVGTLIIYNQLKFIQNKDLGFNKEQVIVINKADDIGNQIKSFKEALLNIPFVKSVSNSNSIPGNQIGDSGYIVEGKSKYDVQDLKLIYCDYGFQKTYNIEMLMGRFFSREHPSDIISVVVNEAVVKAFGLKDPIGKKTRRIR